MVPKRPNVQLNKIKKKHFSEHFTPKMSQHWFYFVVFCVPLTSAAVLARTSPEIHSSMILVIGGECGTVDKPHSCSQLYDITHNTSALAPSSFRLTSRLGMAAAVADQRVYISGGQDVDVHDGNARVSSDVQVFDAIANQTSLGVHMNIPRVYHSMVYYQRKLLVCGGWNPEEAFLISCEKYSMRDMRWTILEQMMVMPRAHHAGVMFGKYMLLIGGGYFLDQYTRHVSAADLSACVSFSWLTLKPLITARIAPVAAEHNDVVYVCGGYSLQQPERSCEMLKAIDHAWEPLTMLSSVGGPRFGSFMVAYSKQLVIGGGKYFPGKNRLLAPAEYGPSGTQDPVGLRTVELYNIGLNYSHVLALPLAERCRFCTAVVLPTMKRAARYATGYGPNQALRCCLSASTCLHLTFTFVVTVKLLFSS